MIGILGMVSSAGIYFVHRGLIKTSWPFMLYDVIKAFSSIGPILVFFAVSMYLFDLMPDRRRWKPPEDSQNHSH
jgi:hypothetical protein